MHESADQLIFDDESQSKYKNHAQNSETSNAISGHNSMLLQSFFSKLQFGKQLERQMIRVKAI